MSSKGPCVAAIATAIVEVFLTPTDMSVIHGAHNARRPAGPPDDNDNDDAAAGAVTAGALTLTLPPALEVGPGRNCSKHHRLEFDSRNEGLKWVEGYF